MSLQTCMHLLMPRSSGMAVRGFIRTVVEWLEPMGIVPELAGITGPGFSGKPVQFARARKRLEDETMEQAKRGSLLTLTPGSESLQDTVLDAIFGAGDDGFIGISHRLRIVSAEAWIDLAARLHPSLPFVYGYVYTMPEEWGPFWYAHGAGYGSVVKPHYPIGEEAIREKWLHARFPGAGPRNMKIRQVYSLQFLSDAHLALRIGVRNLREWIESSSNHGNLKPLVTGMWVWSLDGAKKVRAANEALWGAGLLTAWSPEISEVL